MSKQFDIRFQGIDIISKNVEYPPLDLDLENPVVNFNFLVDVKLAPAEGNAVVITNIGISGPSNTKLAEFRTACIFGFGDFSKYFTLNNDNKYEMPAELEIILKSAGLSTTRGIVYSELRGSYLNNAVFPLVDIASIVLKKREDKPPIETLPER